MTAATEGFPSRPMDNAIKTPSREFKDAAPLLNHPDELRARAQEDGYLYFRGLLPKGTLLNLRRQILEIFQKHHLLDSSCDLMDGIADYEAVNKLSAESVKVFGFPLEMYKEIQKLELFHRVPHEPALLDVFRTLFQAEPFPHPKTMARVVLPHEHVYPTPPHQDYIYVQGSTETWTAWFPLSDCPPELGGLSVLEESHKIGVVGVAPQQGAGGLESILCGYDMEWAVGDYQLGDVLIFNSQTVHRALPNKLNTKIRLSCDVRYQSENNVIDPVSLKPHGRFEWEELYEGWTDDDLKYYWRKLNLTFSEWDETIRWQKEKIC